MDERWLPIEGFDNYQISDKGNVWSRPRERTKGGTLKQTWWGGYPTVGLSLIVGGKSQQKRFRVGILVAKTFLGPCPPGLELCHEDGDRGNSALSNLRWDSHKANMQDMSNKGGTYWSRKTHCAKGHLFDEQNTVHTNEKDGSKHRRCKECRRTESRERWRRAHWPGYTTE